MGAAVLVCRVLLAGVFIGAGVTKLADLPGSRSAAVDFGVPERLAGVVGTLVPVAEIAVGVALVPLSSARFGALGALVLLGVFSAAIVNAVAHGRAPDCHCFGQVHSASVGWPTLARNLVLIGVAGFVAIGASHHGGVSATGWVTSVGGSWLVVIALGLVIVSLVCFQLWFSLQLLSQNGRALARLEALEKALAGVHEAPGLAHDGAVGDPGALGDGLQGTGLPVGSSAPGFDLEAVDGKRYALSSLLAADRRLMLVFTAPGCGPCEALMPDVARWQRDHERSLQIALIASGDREQNRAKASEYGVQRVLLEAEREVSDPYRAPGTPMAVVIEPDGRIASPTVGGADAITALVAQASRPALAIHQVRSANGHRDGVVARAPATSGVGQPPPELLLADLDNHQVALKDLYGVRTLALFWNPGCGFCERMLPELKAFEAAPPRGAPAIVVISSGQAEQVRAQEIGSTVLLDPEGEAMRAFGAAGTPMGVMVEDGRIASPVAAGAEQVLQLMRAPSGSPFESDGGR
jgi:thiol-disulfide isomerase/thioredoxin/uncharacterized membrane protein YphA (DoxX/SURF4 family)